MTREITILPVLNGYICRVGCQTVCFTDRQRLLMELDHYYRDPEGTEKRFLAEAINQPVTDTPPTAERPMGNIEPSSARVGAQVAGAEIRRR